jgi:hypothetical protein
MEDVGYKQGDLDQFSFSGRRGITGWWLLFSFAVPTAKERSHSGGYVTFLRWILGIARSWLSAILLLICFRHSGQAGVIVLAVMGIQ